MYDLYVYWYIRTCFYHSLLSICPIFSYAFLFLLAFKIFYLFYSLLTTGSPRPNSSELASNGVSVGNHSNPLLKVGLEVGCSFSERIQICIWWRGWDREMMKVMADGLWNLFFFNWETRMSDGTRGVESESVRWMKS